MRGTFEEKSRPPLSYPVFLRMCVLHLPHRDETTEISSMYRAETHNSYFSQNRAGTYFSSYRSIWVPKNAEFHANSKSEDEIEKKCTNKMEFLKN